MVRGKPLSTIRSILNKATKPRWPFRELDGQFEITMPMVDVPRLNEMLVRAGVRVEALIPRRSLEDYFLSITEGVSSDRTL